MPKRIERLSREEKLELMFDLINSFSIVKKPKDTAIFLQDLLTANEIKNLAKRLRIAKLLLSGLTQREISEEVDVSLATVNKVALWLDKGGEGFKSVIIKLPRKWAIPEKLPNGPIEYHLPEAMLKFTQYAVSSKQEKPVGKLTTAMEEKGILDRSIKKQTDEYYRLRTIEKSRRGRFSK